MGTYLGYEGQEERNNSEERDEEDGAELGRVVPVAPNLELTSVEVAKDRGEFVPSWNRGCSVRTSRVVSWMQEHESREGRTWRCGVDGRQSGSQRGS